MFISLCRGVSSADDEQKAQARLDMQSGGSSASASSTKLFETRQTLWERDSESASVASALSFALSLPATFELKEAKFPLPPSHSFKIHEASAMQSHLEYSLKFTITKTRRGAFGKLALGKSKVTMYVAHFCLKNGTDISLE